MRARQWRAEEGAGVATAPGIYPGASNCVNINLGVTVFVTMYVYIYFYIHVHIYIYMARVCPMHQMPLIHFLHTVLALSTDR